MLEGSRMALQDLSSSRQSVIVASRIASGRFQSDEFRLAG